MNVAMQWKRITQHATKEVSKGECIIKGYFRHGHIEWKSLESIGNGDQQFLLLIQDSFLTQHVLEPTREIMSKQNVLDKVGSPEDNAGNIISQGFLMAEVLKWIPRFSVNQR